MSHTWPQTDAAGYLGDGRYASATHHPASIEELGSIVAQAAAEGLAAYPQGGRTALDYGGVPARPGVAVDLTGLGRVIDYPHADMTITVEAGMTLAALQAILAEHDQRLPLDAPHPERATIGGIYATNTSGPRRFGAGRPRDQIIGIRFVAADGAAVKGGGRVVKNVAGYDFPKLLTGSMGTLGILAELTLKVRPRPAASALYWAPMRDWAAAAGALDGLVRSATRPIAIELLNRPAAERIGSPAGLPVSDAVLVIGFEDTAPAVAWQLERIAAEVPAAGAAVLRDGEAAPLWQGLVEEPAPGPIGLLANVRPSEVVPLMRELPASCWDARAHAGSGLVRADRRDEPGPETIAPELDRLRTRAVAAGGNLILTRCPTAWKARLKVWGEPRPDWAIAERLKAALDPGRVLNPGRFVGTI